MEKSLLALLKDGDRTNNMDLNVSEDNPIHVENNFGNDTYFNVSNDTKHVVPWGTMKWISILAPIFVFMFAAAILITAGWFLYSYFQVNIIWN
jgi:hypothetical protein